MENVLDIDTAKPDPARPLVCFDEFSKQLLSEIAAPIAPIRARRILPDNRFEATPNTSAKAVPAPS
jgi:hypothetical protein